MMLHRYLLTFRHAYLCLSYILDTTDATIYNFVLMNSTKLRARQKDRIAQRGRMVYSCPGERVSGLESHILCSSRETKDADQATASDNPFREKPVAIDLEDEKFVELSDPPSNKIDSSLKMARHTKQQKMKGHLDLSISSIGHPSSGQFPSTDSHFSNTTTNLLPVLGLYAPNADPSELSRRNAKRSADRQNRPRTSADRQSRPGTGLEFPFSLPPSGPSTGTKLNGQETSPDKLKSPEASSSMHLRSNIPDNCLPINLVLLFSSIILIFQDFLPLFIV